jgi:hypothetical protein
LQPAAERLDGPGEGVTGAIAVQGGWEAFRERHKVMWRGRQFRAMRRVASIVRNGERVCQHALRDPELVIVTC